MLWHPALPLHSMQDLSLWAKGQETPTVNLTVLRALGSCHLQCSCPPSRSHINIAPLNFRASVHLEL